MFARISSSTTAVALALAFAFCGAGAAWAASAGPQPLPAAEASGITGTCLTSPCATDFSLGADQTTTLANFGRNYTVSTVDVAQNPTTFQTQATTPGEVTVSGAGGTSTAIVKGTPFISLNSFADGGQGIAEEAGLYYDFEVVNIASPSSQTFVPIGVNATAGMSGTVVGAGPGFANGINLQEEMFIDLTKIGLADADADFSIAYYLQGSPVETFNQSTSNVTVKLGTTSTFSGGFKVSDMPLLVETDVPQQVLMQIDGDAAGNAFTQLSGFVDPMFTVPAGYEILFSPGIQNGVPEPATWAMMLVGLFGVGGMVRRARREATCVSKASA